MPPPFDVITVTLNPAVDRTVRVRGFAPGAVNRVLETADTPGGKGINVAAALARAGSNGMLARELKVAAAGFLGEANAAIFERHFARLGIADACVRLPGETRLGLKIVDENAAGKSAQTTELNFAGLPPGDVAMAALLERLHAFQQSPRAPWFVLSGSLPPGVPPSFYRDLTRTLRAAGCRVAVDTSGEPLRWVLGKANDETAASPPPPHLLKPNHEELGAALGTPIHSEAAALQAARALVERSRERHGGQGPELVAVSMGKLGAGFATATESLWVRPPEIVAGSAVGAGDAMLAGLIAAQIAGLPLAAAAQQATRFAIAALGSSAG